jgi:integrase
MATITKTPSGKWKAQIRKSNRTIKCKTFTRKTDAVKWSRIFELDRERMEATGSPGAEITFRELVKEIEKSGNNPRPDYRTRYWLQCLGSKKLIDISVQDIRHGLNNYEKGMAMRGNGHDECGRWSIETTGKRRTPATVNRMKAGISSILKYAKEKGYIRKNPARDVAYKPENNKRVRYLSDDERIALLSSCRESAWPKLHLLVTLAITTGARQSELMHLRWNEIDFRTRTALLLKTKNGEPRVLTFPTPAIKELEKFREVGNQLVFPSEKVKEKPFVFRKHWEKALEVAGIEDFRFHDLRHTAASYLVMNGASLYEAGQILGHKSTQTTQRYAHLSIEHKAKVAERVMSQVMDNE